jgi:hypothetical protein
MTRRVPVLLAGAGILGAIFVLRVVAALMPAGTNPVWAALLPAAFVLFAMTLSQMTARFVGLVIDPTAGQETRFLVVNQRVISNTVEQTGVFIPAMLVVLARAPGLAPPMLALGPVFALARLVFWAGYLVTPVGRAPGMAATITVNAAALAAAVAALWG